jgi:hypothetical protein
MATPIYQVWPHPFIEEHIQPDRLPVAVGQLRKWNNTDPIASSNEVIKRLTGQAHAHQSGAIEVLKYHQVELSRQVEDVGLRGLGYRLLRSLESTLCTARGVSHGFEPCFPDGTMEGTNSDLAVRIVNAIDVDAVEENIKF